MHGRKFLRRMAAQRAGKDRCMDRGLWRATHINCHRFTVGHLFPFERAREVVDHARGRRDGLGVDLQAGHSIQTDLHTDFFKHHGCVGAAGRH
ncbi:hypothetical protein D3C71_1405150 [compost metagenome]